jgi:hypothetical protein
MAHRRPAISNSWRCNAGNCGGFAHVKGSLKLLVLPVADQQAHAPGECKPDDRYQHKGKEAPNSSETSYTITLIVLGTVLYTHDLAAVFLAWHMQCRRPDRKFRPYIFPERSGAA